MDDLKLVEKFKATYYVSDEDIISMRKIEMPKERMIQDYRSTYNDIREWLRREKAEKDKEDSTIDWDDIVFEVDLLNPKR